MKVFLLIVALLVSVATAQTFCTTSNLRIRAGPCTSYATVFIIPSGSWVQSLSPNLTTDCSNTWRLIQYQQYTGYVSTTFLGTCPSASPIQFLTGNYTPASYNTFIPFTNGSYGIPSLPVDRLHFLRVDAANALLQMYNDFHAAYPAVPFWVQSSLRTYAEQKAIWDDKWTGSYSGISNLTERGLAVLTFSAIPGASRHHWGTDFDINELTNSYYESGDGLIIKTWLDANAAYYGFCQPYTPGRVSGHSEERWHWSYLPISAGLRADWLSNQGTILNALSGRFNGSEYVLDLAPTYITDINPDCWTYTPSASRTPSPIAPSPVPTASAAPVPSVTPTSTPVPSPSPSPQSSCATSNLRIRAGPCTSYATVFIIPSGAWVQILSPNVTTDCSYDWQQVQYQQYTGWVANKFLGACPAAPTQIQLLTGNYTPGGSNLFIPLTNGGYGIPALPVDRQHFLRVDAANALLQMYNDFHAAYPNVTFWVQSSLRTYAEQKAIWDDKWTGSYSGISNLTERSLAVLTFSAIPGASRHHWGTDFDINELTNSYYESGDGLIIKTWLDANAANYGFCQPYTPGRVSGHSEERWHWSYKPISAGLRADWLSNQGVIFNALSGRFNGSEYALDFAPTYITDINPDCWTYTPSVTPTPTPSITPTSSVTPTVSVTPTASVTPSASVTPTASTTTSVTPSTSITPTASATPSSSVTPSVTPTSSVTPTASSSLTPSVTPSASATAGRWAVSVSLHDAPKLTLQALYGPSEKYQVAFKSLNEIKNGKLNSELDLDDLTWNTTQVLTSNDQYVFQLTGFSSRRNYQLKAIELDFAVKGSTDLLDIHFDVKIQDYRWSTRSGPHTVRNLQLVYSVKDLRSPSSHVSLTGNKAYLNNLYLGINPEQVHAEITEGTSTYQASVAVATPKHNRVTMTYSGFSASNQFDSLLHGAVVRINSPVSGDSTREPVQITLPGQEQTQAPGHQYSMTTGVWVAGGVTALAGVGAFIGKKKWKRGTIATQELHPL